MEVRARDVVHGVKNEHCLIITCRMVEISSKSCSMDRNIFNFVRDLQMGISKFNQGISTSALTFGSERPGSGWPFAMSDSRCAKSLCS